MNLLLKIILPFLVLLGSAFAAKKMIDSKPEAGRRGSPPSVQSVEAITIKPSSFPVNLESQGTVEPTTATTLVSGVAGSVVKLSENLVPGGRFSAGDLLIEIDRRDFEIELTQANANLARAKAELQQEQGQADLAAREWASLRGDAQASPLTLREPQMASSLANVRAMEALVERAQLNLDRTSMIAPYDGVVLESDVDLGQFVNVGTDLGRIYSLAAVDVRLPLANRQVSWLSISDDPSEQKPEVVFSASIGDTEFSWKGTIERFEGFDASTQQLNVIARVNNPETVSDWPLRVGQYVNAQISGSTLNNVFVIPRQALRANDEVVLVTDESTLVKTSVNVAWGDSDLVAVTTGIDSDSVLVTTPLGAVVNGTPVEAIIDGVAPPPKSREGGKPDAAGGKPQDTGQKLPTSGSVGERQGQGEAGGEGGKGADGAEAAEGAKREEGAEGAESAQSEASGGGSTDGRAGRRGGGTAASAGGNTASEQAQRNGKTQTPQNDDST